LLGRLQACVPSARVLIASDHGFGGAGDTAVFLNRWLARSGFLQWQAGGGATALMGRLRQLAVRVIPERWQARCFRLWGGRVAGALETRVRFGGIDWSRTRAFSEELNYFPALWLNLQGRDPQGQVTAAEYDQTCEALRAALLQWRDPLRGTPVVARVWRRDEAFSGPHTELAPDLILELARPDGYSYVCLPSLGVDGEVVRRLAADELAGGKLRGMSGSHRPDGVVMLAGDGIAAGEVDGAWIGDLAPTMLALCGVPAPADWDGHVLPCVTTAARAGAPPLYQPPAETPYATGEEACVQDRLVQLGYLE
jgi:predicted AlkP superfamily phosphohydrolase/phosphomutase